MCDEKSGFARYMGARCIECKGTIKEEAGKVVGVVLAVIVGVIVLYKCCFARFLRHLLKKMTFGQIRKAMYSRQMKVKILLAFVQG